MGHNVRGLHMEMVAAIRVLPCSGLKLCTEAVCAMPKNRCDFVESGKFAHNRRRCDAVIDNFLLT